MTPCGSKVAAAVTSLYMVAVCVCLVGSHYDISACDVGLLALTLPGSIFIASVSERANSLGVPVTYFWLAFIFSVAFNVFVFNWLCWLYRKNNRAQTSARG